MSVEKPEETVRIYTKKEREKIEQELEEVMETSLPTDYADALKVNKKENEAKLLDEKDELIRDYQAGIDFEENKKDISKPAEVIEVKKEEKIPETKEEEVKPVELPEDTSESKEDSINPIEVSEEKKEEKMPEKEEVNSIEGLLDLDYVEKGDKNPAEKIDWIGDNSKEIEDAVENLIALAKKKNKALAEMRKQEGLLHKLTSKLNNVLRNKKEEPQARTEYALAHNEYNVALEDLARLTGKSEKEIVEKYLKEDSSEDNNREKSPEDEKKVAEVKDYLSEKSSETARDIENLKAGKKGAFEKLKTLMTNRKFQFAVGLAIVGVAIVAPPTGFISMITFGLHAGFLPAALATKATALAGIGGGGLLARGLSGFDEVKKQGKKEINLKEGLEKR
jgi:hypothetical protein